MRLLICACDAGSANALVPVLPLVGRSFDLVAQQPAAGILRGAGFGLREILRQDWPPLRESAEKLLLDGSYDKLVTGTSWGSTLDKALVAAAKRRGVASASVVEHWDLYKERFSSIENGCITNELIFLPNEIWVNDSLAVAEAQAAGLPIACLRIVGQPHLEAQYCRMSHAGVATRDATSIVFISERVAEDFIPGTPLDRGFDEHQVLAMLISAMDYSRQSLIVKLHPQERTEKYDYLKAMGIDATIISSCDIPDLITHAGKIVGMFSMLLLEAALVRDDVISLIPSGNPEVFVGNRIGATRPVSSREQLREELEYAPGDGGLSVSTQFAQRFIGSAVSMAKAIEEFAS